MSGAAELNAVRQSVTYTMVADKRIDLNYLLQADLIDSVIASTGKQQWQPLYLSQDTHPDRFGLFCALLTDKAAEKALEHDSWDICIGDGLPGFSQDWSDGEQYAEYHRYGGIGGVRPLIIYRQFYGAFPSYLELCEEFRHYHNLADDPKRGVLLDFDKSGYEIDVARIAPQQIKVRLKYLRRFQAGTQLHVGIYIDSVRYSKLRLEDIPPEQHDLIHVAEDVRYCRNIRRCDHIAEYATFSKLLSKVLLAPPPQDHAGIWPFEKDDRDREVFFIVGTDDHGEPIEHTSDPDKLANYFGGNPGAPHYLTPVYFRKEVLSKYYADPDRYTVSDGHLSCLSLWGCQIDNNHPTHVVVFLVDLGRNLPYEERLHWKQFNVPPEGGMSKTNFRRSFLAQFAAPEAPDLLFREEYQHLSRAWNSSQGWPLFLPPNPEDAHLLDTIRVPVTNSQAELDAQLLTLAKLLIDSLNERELEARGAPPARGDKGITKLGRFLQSTGFAEAQTVVQFLRNLQTLRSTGAAHRKGSAYQRIAADLGVDVRDRPSVMTRILEEATAVLASLGMHYCGDYRPVSSA